MHFATIGTSWITEDFIAATKISNNLKLYSVYSRDKAKGQAFATKHRAKLLFNDLEKMAKSSEIEAVYIASPNIFHYPQSKLFLENGKHVICEKPATITTDQLIELQAIAKENNLVFLEAMKTIHLPAMEEIKDFVAKIGEVSTVILDFSQYSSRYDAFLAGENPNIFSKEMGAGCLMDLGCYCVSLAVYLFCTPKNIKSSGKFLSNNVDIAGSAILEYENHSVSLTYTKSGDSCSPSQIIGEHGAVAIGFIPTLSNVNAYRRNDGMRQKIIGNLDNPKAMSYEAELFFSLINGLKKETADIEEKIETFNNHSMIVCKIINEIRKQIGLELEHSPKLDYVTPSFN